MSSSATGNFYTKISKDSEKPEKKRFKRPLPIIENEAARNSSEKPRFKKPDLGLSRKQQSTGDSSNASSSKLHFTRHNDLQFTANKKDMEDSQLRHSNSRFRGFEDSSDDEDSDNDIQPHREQERPPVESPKLCVAGDTSGNASFMTPLIAANSTPNTSRSSNYETDLQCLSRNYTLMKDMVLDLKNEFLQHRRETSETLGNIMSSLRAVSDKIAETRKKDIIIPKELSRAIVRLYAKLPNDEQWELSQTFTSHTNKNVTEQFIDDISAQLRSFAPQLQHEACKKYFTNLRKEYLLQTKNQEKYEKVQLQKKMRSRRVRLYNRRTRYLKQVEEKNLWSNVKQKDMSDEEDGEGVLRVKSPPWRSEGLTALIRVLDERYNEDVKKSDRNIPMTPRVLSDSPMKRGENDR